jgi:hypothetical protein
MSPFVGWRQDAGWGYQILHFVDAESIWLGGTGTVSARAQAAIGAPLRVFSCPSRRAAARVTNYNNSLYPSQTVYSALKGTNITVSTCDYAGCNGNAPPVSTVGTPTWTPGNGAILSQANGRLTIQTTDISDGTSYTLLLGEKAANPRLTLFNEDDQGFASGFAVVNFNTIRFTSPTLLPLRDVEVTGVTGGAFGSVHPGSWNGLMADGSVQNLSYTIDPTIYSGLGTINGREVLSDADLVP